MLFSLRMKLRQQLGRVRSNATGMLTVVAMLVCLAATARAQAPEGFAWMDQKADSTAVENVAKALADKKYTAIRDIATIGDAALVITTTRKDQTDLPDNDLVTVYSLSLSDGVLEEILSAYRLQWRDWQRFLAEGDPEIVATYQDCVHCQSTTFLTSFYLDRKTKRWRSRWPRDVAGAPLYSEGVGQRGDADQVYALMANPDGSAVLGTWVHFERAQTTYTHSRHHSSHASQAKAEQASAEQAKAERAHPDQAHPDQAQTRTEDYLFFYKTDPQSGQGLANPVIGRDAQALEQRLCKGENVLLGMAAGQDSPGCQQVLHPGTRVYRKSAQPKTFYQPKLPQSMEGKSHPPPAK